MNKEKLNWRRKALIGVLGVICIFLPALLDYWADPDLSFLIFYLIPLFFVTWSLGPRAGFVILALIGTAWAVDDGLVSRSYSHPAIPYWNLLVKLGFFAFIVLLVARLRKALSQEEDLARTDPLTGIGNARYFSEMAEMEIHRSTRYHHPFTVAYFDVDHFKSVNDEFGHSIGDALLKAIAQTLQKGIRNTDIIARLGGDEFVILFPETGFEASQFALRRIQKNLKESLEKSNWRVSFSAGVVTFKTSPPTVDALLYRADQIMYRVKEGGKNQIRHEIWEEISKSGQSVVE